MIRCIWVCKDDVLLTLVVFAQKVFPALVKYAQEHGEKGNIPVVVTTCSIEKQTCTHYAVRVTC